jgi:hypothetical protein
MTERLYQITSTRFVAGITINQYGVVVSADPAAAGMIGWHERRVMNRVREKAWTIKPVQSPALLDTPAGAGKTASALLLLDEAHRGTE